MRRFDIRDVIPRDAHRFGEGFLREAFLPAEGGDSPAERLQGLVGLLDCIASLASAPSMMLGKDTDTSHSDLSIVSKIRNLFLHPRRTYSTAEAAELTGMSLEDVLGWMEVGELEGIEVRGAVVDIEAALGAELAEALPDLLQLADLEVRIPRIEVMTLEKLAARDGKSVDTVLARELRDVMSAQSDLLAREIPGFAAALAWPY